MRWVLSRGGGLDHLQCLIFSRRVNPGNRTLSGLFTLLTPPPSYIVRRVGVVVPATRGSLTPKCGFGRRFVWGNFQMCSPPPRTRYFRFRAGAPPRISAGGPARAPHPFCLGHLDRSVRAGNLFSFGTYDPRLARAPLFPVNNQEYPSQPLTREPSSPLPETTTPPRISSMVMNEPDCTDRQAPWADCHPTQTPGHSTHTHRRIWSQHGHPLGRTGCRAHSHYSLFSPVGAPPGAFQPQRIYPL